MADGFQKAGQIRRFDGRGRRIDQGVKIDPFGRGQGPVQDHPDLAGLVIDGGKGCDRPRFHTQNLDQRFRPPERQMGRSDAAFQVLHVDGAVFGQHDQPQLALLVLEKQVFTMNAREIAALRKHLEGANSAHSRSEAAAANEIRRLTEENSRLKSKLKEQRQSFEKGIQSQEKIVRQHINQLTGETNTLRETMEKLHRNFRLYRENAERERKRLVAEIEKYDAEKISIYELMRKKEEMHKLTTNELEGRSDVQRKEIDELEAENALLRDQVHTETSLSLPGLWQSRQHEMTEAFGRTSEELIMLRERLFEQEEERRAEVKPLLVEIQMLREAQKQHEKQLEERNKLWIEERERSTRP